MKKIGFITVGQTPRPDLSDVWDGLDGLEIIEEGALDRFSDADIKARLAPSRIESVLITKKKNGTVLAINESKISPLIDDCVERLERRGVDIIVLLCTGENVRALDTILTLRLSDVISGHVEASGIKSGIGVLISDARQEEIAQKRWKNVDANVKVFAAASYADMDTHHAMAAQLKSENLSVLILDCIGFTAEHFELYSNALGIPVILPRKAMNVFLKTLLNRN